MVDIARAFLPKNCNKDQINVWFGSHCFELSSSPLLRVRLAFVSAMIVCYLKPKLRARVVLLLVTILVTAMRSGSYCDTAFFPASTCLYALFFSVCLTLRVCVCQCFGSVPTIKSFLWVFFISAISSFFFTIILVICTCFTTRMAASSLLINGFFAIRHAEFAPVTSISEPFFMDATFLFIGLCQLSDAFLKSQLNYINQWTFIFCFRWCLQSHFAFFFHHLPILFPRHLHLSNFFLNKKKIINQKMFALWLFMIWFALWWLDWTE